MHRFTTAAHIGTVHHVIVHESVIVIHLNADSCRERADIVLTIKAIGREQKHGAQAFSPTSENVTNGFVESLRTLGIVEGFNRRFDVFQHGHSREVLAKLPDVLHHLKEGDIINSASARRASAEGRIGGYNLKRRLALSQVMYDTSSGATP